MKLQNSTFKIQIFIFKSGAKVHTFSNMAKKSFAGRIKMCIFALEIKR